MGMRNTQTVPLGGEQGTGGNARCGWMWKPPAIHPQTRTDPSAERILVLWKGDMLGSCGPDSPSVLLVDWEE